VFDEEFVPKFTRAATALPPDWDVFVLNWYCMGSVAQSEKGKAAAAAAEKKSGKKLNPSFSEMCVKNTGQEVVPGTKRGIFPSDMPTA
jgi:hypothetical protein